MPLMEPLQFGVRRSGRAGAMLSPEDEDSLLRSAARSGLSGIGKVGNLLDTPGSMIRDLLTWLPGGMAPVNPFDQLLSPLSGENRTSGRDLLEGYGMRRNVESGMGGWLSDPGEGLRDVAGFATEVLTDPLTWLTGGSWAIGKGGNVGKSAGLLDDVTRVAAKKANVPLGTIGPRQARLTTSLDDLIAYATDPIEAARRVQTAVDPQGLGNVLDAAERAKPVGGLFGVQPPFMDPIGVLGTGPTAQKVAGVLDKYSLNPFALGSAITRSAGGESLRSLMDASVMGKVPWEVQEHAKRTFAAEGRAEQTAKGLGAELARTAEKAGALDSDAALLRRGAAERVPGVVDPTGIGNRANDESVRNLEIQRLAGYDTKELDDVVSRVLRQSGGGRKPSESAPLVGSFSSDTGREDFLKGIRTGTPGLEKIITDSDFEQGIQNLQNVAAQLSASGVVFTKAQFKKAVGAQIEGKYGSEIVPTYRARNADGAYRFRDGVTVPNSEVGQGTWLGNGDWQRLDASGNPNGAPLTPVLKNRAEEIAGWMIENPDRRAGGLFTRDVIADTALDKKITLVKDARANGAYEFLADYAQPAVAGQPGGLKAKDFLEELGLTTDQALSNFAKAKGLPATADPKTLLELEIDPRLAASYLAPRKNYKVPDGAEWWVKQWDNFTNLFKAGVLTAPARYVRDLTSGQAAAMERGMWSGGDFLGMEKFVRGQNLPGSDKVGVLRQMATQRGLSPTEDNTTEMMRLLYAELGPGRAAEQTDVARVAGAAPDYTGGVPELLDVIPGRQPTTRLQAVGDVAKTIAGRTPDVDPIRFNPFSKDFYSQFINIRGVADRAETRLGVVKGGEKIGRFTDDMNRLVPFYNQIKKGVDPAEAMKQVNQLQVSYDPRTFTPTEQALKRLFPFYSFTTRKLLDVGKTLTTNPGGGMGQSVRAVNAGRDDDAMLPEHIADTAAIPLPARVSDGTKRYLTGLGLMFEDPLSMLGGPRQVGLEALSRMNPLVKGPLEWATGQTFFQKSPRGGRPLDDLDPTLGRILANVTGQKDAVRTPQALEAILGNSPLTRGLTSVRQATDSRKNWVDKLFGLGTGVRVSDVSPQAQDAMLREWVQDAEKKIGGKTFTKSYIPDDVKAAMSVQERQNADKFEMLMNAIQNRTKQRREAAGKK